MAKIQKRKRAIKLISTAGTGCFYVTHGMLAKDGVPRPLTLRKYDPVARKHVEFKEKRIK